MGLQMASTALTCTYAAPVSNREALTPNQFAYAGTPTFNVCDWKGTGLYKFVA